jgi:UV DNA damage endonuclease
MSTTLSDREPQPTRLGYACINNTLNPKRVSTNSTCRLDTVKRAGDASGASPGSKPWSQAALQFLCSYGLKNTTAIITILKWHVTTGLSFYRLSSDIFPHIDNDLLIGLLTPEDIEYYRSLEPFRANLELAGEIAYENNIRITMHPSPFAVMGSPEHDKVLNTVVTLKWHARIFVIMEEAIQRKHGIQEAFKDSTLCLHIGGRYDKQGGKVPTLARWAENFNNLLPDWVKRHVAIENCEKSYCVEDLLPLAEQINVPIIFDFHHYKCYTQLHPGVEQAPIAVLLPQILKTWSRRGMRPKFHLSDQDPDKAVGAHHQFVQEIPQELLQLNENGHGFDIMIEAKAKDYAVFYLLSKYPFLCKTKISNPLSMIPVSLHCHFVTSTNSAPTTSATSTRYDSGTLLRTLSKPSKLPPVPLSWRGK